MDAIFEAYRVHAAHVAGGRVDNIEECPRAEGRRGEPHAVEEWQTLYLGGREIVSVREPDGTYRKEERSRAGLDPSTERDRCIPKELRVTEEAVQVATNEEAEEICNDFVEEMEHVMRGTAWRPTARTTLMHAFALIDCVREYCGSGGYWRTGGSDTGYTEISNTDIAAEPVMRLFLRSDDVEINGGVLDSNGVRIQCDEDEKTVLKAHGVQASWWVRWLCMCLHARHNFTHAVATDASRKEYSDGSVGVSVGLWEGVQPLDVGALPWLEAEAIRDGRGESEAGVLRRVGAGMWGAALPSESFDNIVDAEMYAILLYMRRMATASDAMERRCLLLSDCKSALQQVETAWRSGRFESGRGGDRGAMLEEICRLRACLGRVVMVWVPSHRGISPNAMADAIAKSYLTQQVDSDAVRAIAAAVQTRPCLYAVRDSAGSLALRDKRVYKEMYGKVKEWVQVALRKGTKSGILMRMEGTVWQAVARRVGIGMRLETDGDGDGAIEGGGEPADAGVVPQDTAAAAAVADDIAGAAAAAARAVAIAAAVVATVNPAAAAATNATAEAAQASALAAAAETCERRATHAGAGPAAAPPNSQAAAGGEGNVQQSCTQLDLVWSCSR